jgi:hypothetical protein
MNDQLDAERLPDNTHKRQISMPPGAFNSTIPGSKWPQTHSLDRATTGIGRQYALPNDEDVEVKHQFLFHKLHIYHEYLI